MIISSPLAIPPTALVHTPSSRMHVAVVHDVKQTARFSFATLVHWPMPPLRRLLTLSVPLRFCPERMRLSARTGSTSLNCSADQTQCCTCPGPIPANGLSRHRSWTSTSLEIPLRPPTRRVFCSRAMSYCNIKPSKGPGLLDVGSVESEADCFRR